MSKIVFFCIPAYGHTNPTLGVVRELTARGHEVRYYSYEPMRTLIEAAGAQFVACDPYDCEQHLTPADGARVGKDIAFSTHILVETTLALDEMVCADMRAYAPDCIVADSMAVWGKAVAKKLNILHVDTGAIYRTIGYAAFSRGLDAKDESQIAPLLKEIQIDMAFDEIGGQKMLLDGKDVSTEIRLPEISMYASNVSALPCVRAYLLEMQRDIARKRSVIMDGRDIGTVVLPDADLKIYLTASTEERARRRCLELSERGTPKAYEEVLREINERDYQDMHRDIAPLREAEDAVRLDTSKLSFEESERALLNLIQEKLK